MGTMFSGHESGTPLVVRRGCGDLAILVVGVRGRHFVLANDVAQERVGEVPEYFVDNEGQPEDKTDADRYPGRHITDVVEEYLLPAEINPEHLEGRAMMFEDDEVLFTAFGKPVIGRQIDGQWQWTVRGRRPDWLINARGKTPDELYQLYIDEKRRIGFAEVRRHWPDVVFDTNNEVVTARMHWKGSTWQLVRGSLMAGGQGDPVFSWTLFKDNVLDWSYSGYTSTRILAAALERIQDPESQAIGGCTMRAVPMGPKEAPEAQKAPEAPLRAAKDSREVSWPVVAYTGPGEIVTAHAFTPASTWMLVRDLSRHSPVWCWHLFQNNSIAQSFYFPPGHDILSEAGKFIAQRTRPIPPPPPSDVVRLSC